MKNKFMNMNQKGFAPILIALIIALVLGGGYMIAKAKGKSSPKVQNTTVSTTTTNTDTANITTNKGDIKTTVDCKDANCFNQKFISCEPATLQADDGVGYGAANYKIIGKTATGCNITFKYTKYPDPSWVNKEMTCEFDNKLDFKASMTKVFSGVSTGAVVCKGPLFEILRPHN